MTALEQIRGRARALIPAGFLRRDQGDGLLASDFPRHPGGEETAEALRAAGFTVALRGGVAVIGVAAETMNAFCRRIPYTDAPPTEESLFLWALARRLLLRGGDVTEENLPIVYFTLKCLDAGDAGRLEKALRPLSAQALRRRAPLSAAIGLLILNHLIPSSAYDLN